MTYLLPASLAFSIAVMILLCHGDPKRRRAAHQPGAAHGVSMRRLLAVAGLLPGLVLAGTGDAAAFLIWLGGCAVGGWLVALWAGRQPAK